MSRKSVKKPVSKAPRPPRRRSEANRPAASSSSSDPPVTAAAAEFVATRRARSRSKSMSLQGATSTPQSPPKKEVPPKETPSKSPVVKPESSRTRSRTPVTKPDSQLSSARKGSPRDGTTPPKPPPRPSLPVESPPKRKSSESPTESSGGNISKAIRFGKTFERIKEYASSKKAEAGGSSQGQHPGKKSFVFLPDADDISRDVLGQMMSELYGYLGAVQEKCSADHKNQPSTSKEKPGGSSDESLEIVVINVRRRVRRRKESGEKGSPEPKSMTGGHHATRGTPRNIATESCKGESGPRHTPGRFREKSEETVHKHRLPDGDSDSASTPSIKIIELGEIADTCQARLRSLIEGDPEAKGVAASSSKSPRKKKGGDEGTTTRSKSAAYVSDSTQPGSSSYQEPELAAECEKDLERNIESMTKVGLTSSDTPPPSRSVLTQDCETPAIQCQSEYSSSPSYWTWSNAVSTPTPKICDWRLCYLEFMTMFNRQSATVVEFIQNLSSTLLGCVRQPGRGTRRFFLVIGLNVWLLIQHCSTDYWFLCGRGHAGANRGSRVLHPNKSLEHSLSRAQRPSRAATVRNIATEAARRVTGRNRPQSERAPSGEPRPTPEEEGESIEGLFELIRERLPSRPLEPRRDFTAADFPLVTLSFQKDLPEDPATSQTTGGAQSEEEAETNLNDPMDTGTGDGTEIHEDPKEED